MDQTGEALRQKRVELPLHHAVSQDLLRGDRGDPALQQPVDQTRHRRILDQHIPLGHLVIHQPDPQRSRYLEDQANWFAAEFLLPAKEVTDQLPITADWDALAELKVLWRVSMAAILRRARTLGVMPEGAYVQALKTMSTRGWNRREPIRLVQPETPVMLARAAQLLNQSEVTIGQLADDVGLPQTLVTKIVGASTDPRPKVRL